MAVLQNGSGRFQLPCRAVVGRSTLADIPLTSRRASSEHAWLGWSSGRWTLRDLGSSNGTTVNGRPLLTRDRATLSAGSRLCFGGEEESWLLTDASAPEPCAVLLGPQEYTFGLQSLLVLPSAEDPEASIFLEGEAWRVDVGSEITTRESGDIVRLRSGYWRLLLPAVSDSTEAMTAGRDLSIGQLELRFRVNAERLQLTVVQGSTHVQVPSRACLYTLLLLARLRRRAQTNAEGDEGWISAIELAQMRGCSPEKVNVDIHRLRKLFQEAGVHQAAQIIERDDSKRVRIGVRDISEQSA
jgi:hypothetical protein